MSASAAGSGVSPAKRVDTVSRAVGSAVSTNLSQYVVHAVNEPTVGLYFVQQHIHDIVPKLVAQEVTLPCASVACSLALIVCHLQSACQAQSRNVKAATLDVADALATVREMTEMPHIAETLKTLRRLEQQYKPAPKLAAATQAAASASAAPAKT